MVRCFLAFLVFLAPLSVFAEEEKEEWYLAKNGDYLVREANHGNIHALISSSRAGDVNVYLQMFDKDDCDFPGSDKVIDHDPLYVNGTLVKFSQYCSEDIRMFFPTTNKGRKYFLNQFITKSYVDVTTVDGAAEFSFSAIGFTKYFNDLSLRNEGI